MPHTLTELALRVNIYNLRSAKIQLYSTQRYHMYKSSLLLADNSNGPVPLFVLRFEVCNP